jgi:hypothetical protein
MLGPIVGCMMTRQLTRTDDPTPPAPPERSSGRRIQFLVIAANLADADLASLREGDRLNLVADLADYIGDEAQADPMLSKARTSIETIRPALEVIRRCVETVADRAVVDFPAGSYPRVRLDARQGAPVAVYFDVKAPLPDRILLLAFEDLRTAPEAARIRRCKDPKGCRRPGSRLFYAGRTDQEYCSRTCAARVAMQAARNRQGEQRRLVARPTATKKGRAAK